MICNHCHLFWGIFFSFTFLTTSFEAQIVVVLMKFDLSVFVNKSFCVISKKLFPIPGPFDQLKCESLSHVQLSGSPWTTAHQAPPSMELSRQEHWLLLLSHWSELLFPSPGHLPNPGIKPESPTLQAGSLQCDHQESEICLKAVSLEITPPSSTPACSSPSLLFPADRSGPDRLSFHTWMYSTCLESSVSLASTHGWTPSAWSGARLVVGIRHSRGSDSNAGPVPERQHRWPEPLEQGRWLAGSSRACWRHARAEMKDSMPTKSRAARRTRLAGRQEALW